MVTKFHSLDNLKAAFPEWCFKEKTGGYEMLWNEPWKKKAHVELQDSPVSKGLALQA